MYTADDSVIGTVLAGFDGVRGWVHKLAVHPRFQRRGLASEPACGPGGRAPVSAALAADVMEPQMSDVVITDFTAEHQAAAAELVNAELGSRFGFRDDSRNPDLYDIAASYADDCFVVALLAGRLVGTGGLVHESRLVARVVRMHTAQAFRRRGIGAAVLRELVRRAAACGRHELILDTDLDWYDAHAFYAAAGFREFRRNAQGIRFHKLLKGR